jgi:hypothetical protein
MDVLALGGGVAVAHDAGEDGWPEAAFDHDRRERMPHVVKGDPRLAFNVQSGFFGGYLEAASWLISGEARVVLPPTLRRLGSPDGSPA